MIVEDINEITENVDTAFQAYVCVDGVISKADIYTCVNGTIYKVDEVCSHLNSN